MSPNTIAVRLAVTTGLIVWPSLSFADPPAIGATTMAFTGLRAVACDTKQQVEDIIDAGREPGVGMLKKFSEYADLIDAKGEPSCANAMLPPLTVVEVEDEGLTQVADNPEIHSWAIRVAHGNISVWILYREKATEPASPQTYPRDGTVFGAG